MSDHFDDEELSRSYAAKHSSSGGSGQETRTPSDPAARVVSDAESKRIMWTKFYLALVLLLSAAGIATFTYFYANGLEQSKFEQQFKDDAEEIMRISERNALKAFRTLEDFSRTITSLGSYEAGNETFPLLTIPDFEIRAQDFQDLTGSTWIGYIPLVDHETRPAFERYIVEHQGWLAKAKEAAGTNDEPYPPAMGLLWKFVPNPDPATNETNPYIIGPEDYNAEPLAPFMAPFYPMWQSYPPQDSFGMPASLWIGHNMLSTPYWITSVMSTTLKRKPILGEMMIDTNLRTPTDTGVGVLTPDSILFQPIFRDNDDPNSDIVGFLMLYLPWDAYFRNILSESDYGIVVEVESSCSAKATFLLEGSKVTPLNFTPSVWVTGENTTDDGGDHENIKHLVNSRFEVHSQFAEFTRCEGDFCETSCDFELHIFPHHEMDDVFHTSLPEYLTVAVIVLFAFTSLVFILYDYLIRRRNSKVIDSATKNNAIVAKLFPAQVHDRLFGMKEAETRESKSGKKISVIPEGAKFKLNSFLTSSNARAGPDGSPAAGHNNGQGESLADFFPSCTVMFGDIKGFTAWSSIRDPVQVFTLLETIYGAFDQLAKKRKILKVESVKDSYLAVCGVPTPREDHAVAMARFASDCNDEMNRLVQYLEKMLGPDTSTLSMRFGLHSGAVTAGVLRGVSKARFQLFGDTVNTAARMETTGEARRIHASDVTAKLLQERGKGHWLKPRDSTVEAKGKGKLQTFWVSPKATETSSTGSSSVSKTSETLALEHFQSSHVNSDAKSKLNKKLQRIVEWNTELLLKLLKQIVARRRSTTYQGKTSSPPTGIKRRPGATVMDEVTEIVKLPKFKASKNQVDPNTIELELEVEEQLEDFVANIASMYHPNHFHNYEHASHVTMSVSKMLSRIVAPEIEEPSADLAAKEYEAKLHDHTYGITSDPLTQFAVVFSALIHDVDHPGVPNATLVKEGVPLATKYKNTSVAEQNSVDLAWDLLMQDKYTKLRGCIYATQAELERFRQWVVTAVMSTDIVDKGLKELRNARWERAFSEDKTVGSSSSVEDSNRKATIVVEHIIQASDISHTMQHWHVYLKWNEKFFREMYAAYKAGRSDTDPSTFWYRGELGFYDYYIIPLAKKLKECGVFGVSSDEYLDYAMANRREWEARGKEVVARFVRSYVETEVTTNSLPRRLSGEVKRDGMVRASVDC